MKTEITEESGIHKEWYELAESIRNFDQFGSFWQKLNSYQNDYGTCVHATAALALAAANLANHSELTNGGITGFQAGCVMWEFIGHWLHLDGKPLRLVQYENMLYPQYEESFDKTISKDTWAYLQEQAAKKIKEADSFASPTVLAHWQSIATGNIPFGYRLGER